MFREPCAFLSGDIAYLYSEPACAFVDASDHGLLVGSRQRNIARGALVISKTEQFGQLCSGDLVSVVVSSGRCACICDGQLQLLPCEQGFTRPLRLIGLQPADAAWGSPLGDGAAIELRSGADESCFQLQPDGCIGVAASGGGLGCTFLLLSDGPAPDSPDWADPRITGRGRLAGHQKWPA